MTERSYRVHAGAARVSVFNANRQGAVSATARVHYWERLEPVQLPGGPGYTLGRSGVTHEMAKIVSHAKDCNRLELLTKRPPCAYLTASSAGRIALRARGVVLGGQAGRPLAGWGQRPHREAKRGSC